MRRASETFGKIGLTLILAFTAGGAGEGKKPQRPRITAIGKVEILSSNLSAADSFYEQIASLDQSCASCQKSHDNTVRTSGGLQLIELAQLRKKRETNLLVRITFLIDDQTAMKQWLKLNGIPFKERSAGLASMPSTLSVIDPEGHEVQFAIGFGVRLEKLDSRAVPPLGTAMVSLGNDRYAVRGPAQPSNSTNRGKMHLIHAGFVVKDRAAMDKFYKDILGFHVYWHGGMKDGETDWVDMQVPDGTDWIEYMLNVPENADKQTLGIMNHIALGVPDVRAAAKQLEAQGMKLPEPPQMGRDGKWQLNLYDPDDTRVELMEFTPTQKPCCSDYTGPHPKP